jgi:hypothetical protein
MSAAPRLPAPAYFSNPLEKYRPDEPQKTGKKLGRLREERLFGSGNFGSSIIAGNQLIEKFLMVQKLTNMEADINASFSTLTLPIFPLTF